MKTLSASQLIDQYGIDYFKGASTLGALTDNAIRYLLENGEVQQLEKGELLYRYGDSADCFYIVLKGTISLLKMDAEGASCAKEFTFGHELGYVAMISLQPRAGTAEVVEESIVLKVPSFLFYKFEQNYSVEFEVFLLNLSREMARRLHDSIE